MSSPAKSANKESGHTRYYGAFKLQKLWDRMPRRFTVVMAFHKLRHFHASLYRVSLLSSARNVRTHDHSLVAAIESHEQQLQSTLVQQIAQLTSQLERLRQESAEKDDRHLQVEKDLKRQLKELHTTQQDTETQLTTERNRCQSLIQQKIELREELHGVKEEFVTLVEIFDADKTISAHQKTEIENLKILLKESETRYANEKIKNQESRIRRELDVLSEKCIELQQLHQQAQAALDEKQTTIQTLQLSLDNAVTENNGFKTSMEALESEIKSAKAVIEDLERSKRQLESKVDEKDKILSSFKKSFSTQREELNRVEAENKILSSKCDDLGDKVKLNQEVVQQLNLSIEKKSTETTRQELESKCKEFVNRLTIASTVHECKMIYCAWAQLKLKSKLAIVLKERNESHRKHINESRRSLVYSRMFHYMSSCRFGDLQNVLKRWSITVRERKSEADRKVLLIECSHLKSKQEQLEHDKEQILNQLEILTNEKTAAEDEIRLVQSQRDECLLIVKNLQSVNSNLETRVARITSDFDRQLPLQKYLTNFVTTLQSRIDRVRIFSFCRLQTVIRGGATVEHKLQGIHLLKSILSSVHRKHYRDWFKMNVEKDIHSKERQQREQEIKINVLEKSLTETQFQLDELIVESDQAEKSIQKLKEQLKLKDVELARGSHVRSQYDASVQELDLEVEKLNQVLDLKTEEIQGLNRHFKLQSLFEDLSNKLSNHKRFGISSLRVPSTIKSINRQSRSRIRNSNAASNLLQVAVCKLLLLYNKSMGCRGVCRGWYKWQTIHNLQAIKEKAQRYADEWTQLKRLFRMKLMLKILTCRQKLLIGRKFFQWVSNISIESSVDSSRIVSNSLSPSQWKRGGQQPESSHRQVQELTNQLRTKEQKLRTSEMAFLKLFKFGKLIWRLNPRFCSIASIWISSCFYQWKARYSNTDRNGTFQEHSAEDDEDEYNDDDDIDNLLGLNRSATDRNGRKTLKKRSEGKSLLSDADLKWMLKLGQLRLLLILRKHYRRSKINWMLSQSFEKISTRRIETEFNSVLEDCKVYQSKQIEAEKENQTLRKANEKFKMLVEKLKKSNSTNTKHTLTQQPVLTPPTTTVTKQSEQKPKSAVESEVRSSRSQVKPLQQPLVHSSRNSPIRNQEDAYHITDEEEDEEESFDDLPLFESDQHGTSNRTHQTSKPSIPVPIPKRELRSDQVHELGSEQSGSEDESTDLPIYDSGHRRTDFGFKSSSRHPHAAGATVKKRQAARHESIQDEPEHLQISADDTTSESKGLEQSQRVENSSVLTVGAVFVKKLAGVLFNHEADQQRLKLGLSRWKGWIKSQIAGCSSLRSAIQRILSKQSVHCLIHWRISSSKQVVSALQMAAAQTLAAQRLLFLLNGRQQKRLLRQITIYRGAVLDSKRKLAWIRLFSRFMNNVVGLHGQRKGFLQWRVIYAMSRFEGMYLHLKRDVECNATQKEFLLKDLRSIQSKLLQAESRISDLRTENAELLNELNQGRGSNRRLSRFNDSPTNRSGGLDSPKASAILSPVSSPVSTVNWSLSPVRHNNGKENLSSHPVTPILRPSVHSIAHTVRYGPDSPAIQEVNRSTSSPAPSVTKPKPSPWYFADN
eukprot:GILJ01013952.1.p1 GENE.GILJ01013952.1~~GILJ01013952.1.p1  ORF type:complete len:1607 (-),score=301.05 GILJ01013952.1:87-4907(-)